MCQEHFLDFRHSCGHVVSLNKTVCDKLKAEQLRAARAWCFGTTPRRVCSTRPAFHRQHSGARCDKCAGAARKHGKENGRTKNTKAPVQARAKTQDKDKTAVSAPMPTPLKEVAALRLQPNVVTNSSRASRRVQFGHAPVSPLSVNYDNEPLPDADFLSMVSDSPYRSSSRVSSRAQSQIDDLNREIDEAAALWKGMGR
jgi:hypothetical protein